MVKYAIGIEHPERGKLFLRTIQTKEAHVTENKNYIRSSALFDTPEEAYKTIGHVEKLWKSEKRYKRRDYLLLKSTKHVLKWDTPTAVAEDVFVKKMEDF